MSNTNPHILVDLNEAAQVLMDFIGSERFNNMISSIENNAKAGFTAGLSFALCLEMGECKTFLYRAKEDDKDGCEEADS